MSKKTETAGPGRASAESSASQSRARLVRELQRQLFDQLGARIKDTVQETESELFDAMEQARDNVARTSYMESITAFRKCRQEVVNGFLRVHLDSFNAYFSGRGFRQQASDEEQPQETQKRIKLSLLKKEEQEEDLLLHTMASRLNRQYSLELVVMRRRLAHMADASYDDEAPSPLCPDSITASLQSSLQDIGISSGLKSFVYVQFERHVMQGLRQVYEELDRFFSEHRVLPGLSVDDILTEMSVAQRERQQVAAAAEADAEEEQTQEQTEEQISGGPQGQTRRLASRNYMQQASRGMAPGQGMQAQEAGQHVGGAAQARADRPASGQSETPYQQQIEHQINEINQLLGSYRSSLGVVLPSGSRMLDSFAPPGASKNYSQDQVMQALQDMQHQRARSSVREEENTDAFKQSMYQTLATATNNPKDFRIDGNQSNLIDLVGMLFDFVKEERRLADDHKDVLIHLQNLYCQVALRDASFFHNTQHPAHLLLNRMVQAGNEYQGETEQRQLSETIEGTVKQALIEYQHDDQVFERLLQQFDQQVASLQNRVDRREQRAVDAAKGREKLIFARKHARGFIEVCVKKHNPPEIIRAFLQAAWTDVLVFYFLRTGPSSAQWQEKAKIAEELSWCCTPLDEEQRKQFVARKDLMMSGIQQALEQLGYYSDVEIQRQIQDIQICQQAVQAQQHEVVEKLSNTLPSSMTEADEEELRDVERVNENSLDEASLELVNKLKHVRFGTWFEFKEPPHRLKLAWFSPTTHRYMFVDSAGQGSYIKNWNELFEQLKAGEASIVEAVEAVPFFERALQAIQRTLKQFAGSYVSEIRDSKPAPA